MSDDGNPTEDLDSDDDTYEPVIGETDDAVYFFVRGDDEDAIDQIVAAWAKKFGKT